MEAICRRVEDTARLSGRGRNISGRRRTDNAGPDRERQCVCARGRGVIAPAIPSRFYSSRDGGRCPPMHCGGA